MDVRIDPNAPAQTQGIEPGEVWTLTYDMVIPKPTSVGRTFTNDAYVHQYAALTNTPGQTATFYPQDNVDQSLPLGDELAASDPSNVFTPAVVVAKTGTTALTETNNNQATQATVGETVTYTYSVTIPAGTSVFAGSLTDAPPTGFVASGPAMLEFCPQAPAPGAAGTTAPRPVGVTLDAITGSLTFGDVYDNTTAFPQRFSVTIPVQVTEAALDVSENAENRTNTATFSSTLVAGGSNLDPVRATYTINVRRPRAVVTKSNSTTGPVVGGATVTFTVTARNENSDGTSTDRPPLHDAVLVDCLPPELILVPGSLTDGGTTTTGDGSNGCLVGWTKLTWPVGDVAPGATVARSYTATVTPAAVGGDTYVNTATLTGTSMPGQVAGERTYSATTTSAVTIRGAALTKTVDKKAVTIGETATWTVRVTTAPNVTYYGAAILDQVPAGLTGITTVAATCRTIADVDCSADFPGLGTALTPSPSTPLDGSVPVTYGWLAGNVPGDGAVRIFTVTYTGRVADLAANKAGVASTNTVGAGWNTAPGTLPTSAGQAFDRKSGQVPATVTVIEPSPVILKAVSDATPDPGQVFDYTLRVTNGPASNLSDAYNLVVTDVVPVGVVVDPATISDGGAISPLPVPTTGGGVITWDAVDLPGPLAPNASRELTYSARLAPSGSLTGTPPGNVLTNTATITSYTSLPSGGRVYPARPSAKAQVTPDFPLLQSSKTATGGPLTYIGDPYTWTVTTTNQGGATAYAVDIRDILPPNWTYEPGSAQLTVAGIPRGQKEPATLTVGGRQRLTWADVGSLAPRRSATVVFRAVPQPEVVTSPGVGSTVAQVNDVNSFGEDATRATGNKDGAYGDRPASAQTRIDSADLVIDKDHVGTPVAGPRVTTGP